MTNFEGKFKDRFEKTIKPRIEKAEAHKKDYERAANNAKDLAEQINFYMQKFDQMKVTINDSGKVFETA